MMDQGLEGGLSNEFIESIYKAVHQESIHHQQKMFD